MNISSPFIILTSFTAILWLKNKNNNNKMKFKRVKIFFFAIEILKYSIMRDV